MVFPGALGIRDGHLIEEIASRTREIPNTDAGTRTLD